MVFCSSVKAFLNQELKFYLIYKRKLVTFVEEIDKDLLEEPTYIFLVINVSIM